MAADDQIIVDIKVKDKEINQAEKSIDRLTDSIEELGNSINDTRALNKKYKKDQEELNKLYKAGEISLEKYEKEVDILNAKIKVNNKQIANSTVQLSKQKQERSANIKLINSEVNSRDKLRQKISILTKEYNGLNTETREGQKRFDEIQKELKQLNKDLNDGSIAAGNFKDNIGNYPDASNQLAEIGDRLSDVGGASAGAVGGIQSMGAAFKALLANPVVLVIAAIVAGISALFSAFKRSESGSKLLSKAMAGLKGVMAVVTKLADSIGNAFSGSMDEAEESSISFWDFIKQTFVRRIEGLLLLMQSVGDGISAIFTGSTEDLEKAATKAKNALIQVGTGLNEAEFDTVTDKMKALADEAARIAQTFIALEAAQRSSRSAARFLEKDVAKLSATFEQLSEVAGDDTRNLHEMRQAAIDAGEAGAQLAEKQVKLAKVRLGIINQEVSVRRGAGEAIQDLLDEQAQAQVALTEATSQAAIAQQKILIEQRKIERDIFEQNLDILLDVGDKIKTAQEKAIQNESLSLDARKKLLKANQAALKANFDAIKAEYELYGVTAEQINEVITASDAKQTNERLKALELNEIANNRLREIVLERRQADLDYNDLQKQLGEEELERKEEANEIIAEIDEEFALSQIEDAEKLKNQLIKLEVDRLVAKLEDNTLIEEEREALIAKTEANIRDIEQNYSVERRARDKEDTENRTKSFLDSLAAISVATEEFAGVEGVLFAAMSASIAKSFEDGKISIEEVLSTIGVLSNALFDSMDARRAEQYEQIQRERDNELKKLDEDLSNRLQILRDESFREVDLLQKEKDEKERIELKALADSGDADAKFKLAQLEANEKFLKGKEDAERASAKEKERIEKNLKKNSDRLKLKQFEDDKKRALIQVAISTATGAAKALTSAPPPISFALAGATIVFGGVQAALINRSRAPRLGKGTSDIVSIGDSHASGRDVDVWGTSGGQTQHFGKVEKGEVMPVIRKSAANDYMVSKLNGQFSGGNGRSFQNGTPDVTAQQPGGADSQELLNNMIAAFSNIQIVAKIEDITKEANKKIQIVNNSKI